MKYLAFTLLMSVMLGQDDDIDLDTVNLDLDALWENTVWEEIEDVVDVYYEVEQVTYVAGVRGAEAEDEALQLLYYRRSMKGLAKLDIQKALGKLIIKRQEMPDDHKDYQKNRWLHISIKNKVKKSLNFLLLEYIY